MADFAFDVLRQVAFPGGIFDQDYLSGADDPAFTVAGSYVYTRVEIDDVLAAWCWVPVDVVLRRGLAKDNPLLRQSVDLEQRVNLCRTKRQQTAPLPFESTELMALAAFCRAFKNWAARRYRRPTPPVIHSVA
jgi:hypothetical protein